MQERKEGGWKKRKGLNGLFCENKLRPGQFWILTPVLAFCLFAKNRTSHILGLPASTSHMLRSQACTIKPSLTRGLREVMVFPRVLLTPPILFPEVVNVHHYQASHLGLPGHTWPCATNESSDCNTKEKTYLKHGDFCCWDDCAVLQHELYRWQHHVATFKGCTLLFVSHVPNINWAGQGLAFPLMWSIFLSSETVFLP